MCKYYIGHLLTKSSHCSHGPCVKEGPFSGCDLGSQDCLGQWCCVQSNKSMGFFTPKDKFIKFRSLLLIAKSGAKMSSIPCIHWCSTKPSKWHSRIRSVSFLEILIFITAEMRPTQFFYWTVHNCYQSEVAAAAGQQIQFIAEMLPWLDHLFFLCTAIVFATILFRYCKRTATRKWHALSIKSGRKGTTSCQYQLCFPDGLSWRWKQAKNSPLLYFSSSIFYYSLYRWKHVSKLICKNSNWGTRFCFNTEILQLFGECVWYTDSWLSSFALFWKKVPLHFIEKLHSFSLLIFQTWKDLLHFLFLIPI